GTLVRFRIRAASGSGAERVHPPPGDAALSFVPLPPDGPARIPLGHLVRVGPRPGASSRRPQRGAAPGEGAFVYVPPDGGASQTFDPARIVPWKKGFKLRFPKDRPLHGLDRVELILEGPPRWALSEPLSHELYRRAGVPAPATEHLRL